jgi:hypothetical protein
VISVILDETHKTGSKIQRGFFDFYKEKKKITFFLKAVI